MGNFTTIIVLGQRVTPSIFLLAAGILVVGIFVFAWHQERKALMLGAMRIHKSYQESKKPPALRPATQIDIGQLSSNEAIQRWESECRACNLTKIGYQIEEYGQMVALHSVWFLPEFHTFAGAFATNDSPSIAGRWLVSRCQDGQIFGLSDNNGMSVSVPGSLTSTICETTVSTQEMFSIFSALPGCLPDSQIEASQACLDAIRNRLQEIKAKVFQDNQGVIPFEVLERLSSGKDPKFLRAIHRTIQKIAKAS